MSRDTRLDEQLAVVEIEKLRDEINHRLGHQVQILSISLSGAVALLGAAFGYRAYWLLLLIPMFSAGCGFMYVSWQFAIMRIGEYLQQTLPEAGWETFLRSKLQHPKQFRMGNLYPLGAAYILCAPTVAAWALFLFFAVRGKIAVDLLQGVLVGIYFVVSFVLMYTVCRGLRETLWESSSAGSPRARGE